ncbi:glycoside hydrolase N-terminal domain-containing protein, partial [uncultured Duncaniella sp.]
MNVRNTITIAIAAAFSLQSCSSHDGSCGDGDYCLWYSSPAEKWEEALPLGNGRLGAMVFGNPYEELYQLNEETLWSGG